MAASGRARRWVIRAAAVVFCVAVVAGIAVALRGQDWNSLLRLVRPASTPALLLALLLSSAGLLAGMRAWTLTLGALGSPVPPRPGARMFYVGFLGKFIPGRVWGLVAQMSLGQAQGVGKARMLGVYVINLVVVFAAGGTVGLLVAPALPGTTALWALVPLAGFVVLLAKPRLVDRLAALAARVTRRPAPEPLARPDLLRRSLAYQSLSWFLSGLHVWIVAVLLGADPLRALPIGVGAFSLAASAGTLAIFLPDGAGVREVILLATLTAVLPLPAAATTALASRLLSTLGELLCSAVVLLVVSDRRRAPAPVAAEPLP